MDPDWPWPEMIRGETLPFVKNGQQPLFMPGIQISVRNIFMPWLEPVTLRGTCAVHDELLERRRVEIGGTWYRKSTQRTALNTECKLLLLTHAFETLDCICVELRTNFFNHPSRRANTTANGPDNRRHLSLEPGESAGFSRERR
jgi:hypothetical protein